MLENLDLQWNDRGMKNEWIHHVGSAWRDQPTDKIPQKTVVLRVSFCLCLSIFFQHIKYSLKEVECYTIVSLFLIFAIQEP
jgi:hypothetical protein